jgi:hypothetical protein
MACCKASKLLKTNLLQAKSDIQAVYKQENVFSKTTYKHPKGQS